MAHCTACGHPLGVGRFCTNCGQPISLSLLDPERTDTVVRRPVPPADPSTVPVQPTTPPRFPLFADEVEPATRASNGPPGAVPPPGQGQEPSTHRARRRGWLLPLVVLALVLLVIVTIGIWMLGRSGDDDAGTAADPVPSEAPSASVEPEQPAEEPAEDLDPPMAPDQVGDLARDASASAPVTAPPSQGLDGSPVDFDAARMLDGDKSTAWRMPGDGTGTVLTFDLPEGSVLTEVGLVNGYAKRDTGPGGGTVRWYRQNRKVERVTWIFPDGTQLVQDLEETQQMQTIPVDPIRAERVRLRIEAVSGHGTGPRGRNFTPISEVWLRGGIED